MPIVYMLMPVEVEGVVEHKVINGYYGNTCESIFNRPYPDGPWILAESSDVEKLFSQEDRNLYINNSLKELLERKYSRVDYYVGIRLISDDPANDAQEGDTVTYFVSMEDFNKIKIGDTIECKISRYRFARIDKITVL
ncbi:hypothetical protein [Methanolobus psychrotolerans]|uniref:hypothetical protein n=1 Tax=Methanolobus psychrotolerans TaxID=1874706 RepID=UPI000B91A7F4|nr:hypothetical protein [Methanolobus psychrotolerans]